jgi:hypothetical protein
MNIAALQEWTIRTALCIVSLIHLLPLIGVTGRTALEKAYGIPVNSPDLQLLLQHRAVLFGLLCAACAIAAFNAPWRPAVWCAALISTCSFLLLAWTIPSYNAAIARVIWLDAIAVAMLLLAGAAYLFRTNKTRG